MQLWDERSTKYKVSRPGKEVMLKNVPSHMSNTYDLLF